LSLAHHRLFALAAGVGLGVVEEVHAGVGEQAGGHHLAAAETSVSTWLW
jgi:hypothetical protein